MFNKKYVEDLLKKLLSPREVYAQSRAEKRIDEIVSENSLKLKCYYADLTKCTKALDAMVESVGRRVVNSGSPCEELRMALERCYSCHCKQPLTCAAAVQRLADCARLYAAER